LGRIICKGRETAPERDKMKKTNAKQQEFDESVLEYIRHCNSFGHICNNFFISARFDVDERRARESIARLRKKNAILNFQDGQGYILPNEFDELGQAQIKRWKQQEFGRAMSIIVGLKGATMAQSDPNQLKIDMDGFVSELLESFGANEYNPVVEMYFEAMKTRCKDSRCFIEGVKCRYYDSCNPIMNYRRRMDMNFTDLTPAQITALEPYALAWAESEGTE
jgi:hypothetical protein